jgi:hypothetical protein
METGFVVDPLDHPAKASTNIGVWPIYGVAPLRSTRGIDGCLKKFLTHRQTYANLRTMITTELIDEAFQSTMKQIEAAAKTGDLAAATALTRKAAACNDLKQSLISLEEQFKKLQSTKPPPIATATNGEVKLRELPVEVTGGMIGQNYLTLTTHIQRGRIQIGEDLTIEAHPSGERFRTQLLEKGNKLRERGAIARFYREAGVHVGDFVVLTEVAPKQWTLKKAAPGRYQSRRSLLESL